MYIILNKYYVFYIYILCIVYKFGFLLLYIVVFNLYIVVKVRIFIGFGNVMF